ncbi:MAG: fibrobacter succinogenes major paralogous domain-containing protein, partial [Candidatus Nomurabacteria bacterium]|nr:fibrobacter succinogenes major paralogous domain-containing protein [Candidatus Nomurabacteria bacterium]
MKIFVQKSDENKVAKTHHQKRRQLTPASFCIIFAGIAALLAVGLVGFTRASSVANSYPNIGLVVGGTEVTITGDFSQPTPTTMQDMTKGYCTSMTVYDGTNPSAILTLKDTRGGPQYQVAKLADGNCWMLDNLKLADYTATAADTDLNDISSFTIPALDTTKNSNADTPYVYGPMPGDTGAGATNYGYLYNWPAVTAGESMTTMPGDDTKNNLAPNSICPKGWRLPVGGEVFEVSNEFDQLNAAMAGY